MFVNVLFVKNVGKSCFVILERLVGDWFSLSEGRVFGRYSLLFGVVFVCRVLLVRMEGFVLWVD